MSKTKKIPFSNYIKLLFLIIVTVVGVFVFRNVYLSNEDYNNNIPIIRDYVVSEINSKEIYNYIREDNDAIIYMGVASSKTCRDYENVLKDIITKYFLEDDITYLNISSLKNKKTFINEFNKFYDADLEDYPSLIIFRDGVVSDILTIDDKDNMKDKTINFLLDNEIPLNEGD